MTHIDIGGSSVTDWENFILNRTNTREISGHGGGNYLSGKIRTIMSHPDSTRLYGHVVQAVLNCWDDLIAVERDPYEAEPVDTVAQAPFGPRFQFFNEDARTQYNRLWLESPRPHSVVHRRMALNSRGELPVTRAEIGLLFELPGWGLTATRVASMKKWNNTAIDLMKDLYGRKTELRTSTIEQLVKDGFPKLKGLRWIYMTQNDGPFTRSITERWQQELLAEGASRKEVFLKEV